MREKQHGFGYVEAGIALFVIAFAATAIFTYKHAILKAERAEQKYQQELVERIRAEKELEGERIIAEKKVEAANIARDLQIEHALNAEQRKQKASADKIAETSARDAEKYTGFVRRVGKKNLELLSCKSDIRNAGKEDACIGHVR